VTDRQPDGQTERRIDHTTVTSVTTGGIVIAMPPNNINNVKGQSHLALGSIATNMLFGEGKSYGVGDGPVGESC